MINVLHVNVWVWDGNNACLLEINRVNDILAFFLAWRVLQQETAGIFGAGVTPVCLPSTFGASWPLKMSAAFQKGIFSEKWEAR